MKNGIVALLSALALTLAFTGCSESDGAYSATTVSDTVITEADTAATTFTKTNEFGLNPSLGTPPPLPAS